MQLFFMLTLGDEADLLIYIIGRMDAFPDCNPRP
jgi:hypothetical protein